MDVLIEDTDSSKADGFVMNTIYDPSNLEYFATAGCFAWESAKTAGKPKAIRDRWGMFRLGNAKYVKEYYEATEILGAAMNGDFFQSLQPSLQYVDENNAPNWPAAMLDKLSTDKKSNSKFFYK